MASDLHLVQLDLDVSFLMKVARDRGWSIPRGNWEDLGYLIHHQLAAVFQDLAPRPFRAFEQKSRWLTVLGYSSASADALRQRADEFGRPAERGACRLDGLHTKPMPASLFETGRKLGFEVRTCPVVRLAKQVELEWCGKPAVFEAGKELDAYLHRRFLQNSEEVDRETVYLDWLRQRFDGTARVVSAELHAFRRIRVLRRGKRNEEGERDPDIRERPDALMIGTLEVQDGAAFRGLLARGVGRHRAFGFGMLLLRPPG